MSATTERQLRRDLREQIAERFRNRTATAAVATPVLLAGFGSLARPALDQLLDVGAVAQAVLVDPASYRPASVATQCLADEVGLAKVKVGRRRAGEQRVACEAMETGIESLAHGRVRAGAIMISSMDNRHAEIAANRLAIDMGCRLVKLNVEPTYGIVSLRCFDYRKTCAPCLECQFTSAHYDDQLHPHSCDLAARQPHTNSPRELSMLAGALVSLAVTDLTAESNLERWINQQWVLTTGGPMIERSILEANPNCRCPHEKQWPDLERLAAGPGDMTLGDLLSAFPRGRHDLVLRFGHCVALKQGCTECGLVRPTVRWVADLNDQLGQCRCGGDTQAVPFWLYRELPVSRVRGLIHMPLAEWGVPQGALISVVSDDRTRSFVIGGGAAPEESQPLGAEA